MKKTEHTYRSTDKMSDLIVDNYSLLMVMSRFGLKLGFGDSTVAQVCMEQQVNCATFLSVANFINGNIGQQQESFDDIDLSSLMSYLENAHSYFLDFSLPAIRRKLIEALDFAAPNNVAILILKFFDDYVGEVRRHMEFENNTLFGYVADLQKGIYSGKTASMLHATKHTAIEAKIRELKNIIIKYYPAQGNNNLMNAVLFDIFSCEQDISSHCLVEDCILMPLVVKLENAQQ